jgi:hypothetical protein
MIPMILPVLSLAEIAKYQLLLRTLEEERESRGDYTLSWLEVYCFYDINIHNLILRKSD